MIVQYRPITYIKIRVPFQAGQSIQKTSIISEYVSNLLIIIVFTLY